MQPSAQDFIFDWQVRPIEKNDLLSVAAWIAALSGGQQDEIYGSLILEFHSAEVSGSPDLYAGLVDDQLVCYISGYPPDRPKDRPVTDPRDTEYRLYMIINTQMENYEQLWAPAWNCTIQHFFLIPDITRIRVHIMAGDPAQKALMEKMGFSFAGAEIHPRSRYMDIYTGTRDDFRPLF